MDIADFFPKYSYIPVSKYPVLNAYDENFYNTIFHKKEFYENRLEKIEEFPKEKGMPMKYQRTIARFFSGHTPYDRLLLCHAMGSGKTCSAIQAIELIKNEPNNSFTGAIIISRSPNVLENFQRELVEKCTTGQYIPENYANLTEMEKVHRIKKRTKYYQFQTTAKFAKKIKSYTTQEIIDIFSNKIIVIDEVHNLRISDDGKKENSEIYEEFHKFLHLIQNCKILLMTGTPIKDSPEEFPALVNLIISKKEQLPLGEEFLTTYMIKKENTHYLNPEKTEEIKRKLIGKISFLREVESTVEKVYIGQKNYGKLSHFVVNPCVMSDFQTKIYTESLAEDKGGISGVYINTRESSLFCFPDGSYGRKGFDKYIEVKKQKRMGVGKRENTINSYRLANSLRASVYATTTEKILENIRKYSALYATVLQKILTVKGNCFIYCSLVQGSGAILFSLLLELLGYTRATGKETTPGLRYAILSNETSKSKDVRRINNRYNELDNTHGEIIKVIIGSKTVAESFSLQSVVFEAILTPWWNYSEISQALARGIRLGSHNHLKNPKVEIMLPVSVPNNGEISIDLLMYETSEDKEVAIKSIMRMLLEVAFDCGLNYMRNFVAGKDGSRECFYSSCEYACFGMNMEMVKNGLNDEELDYSTYQLYYSNPRISLARQKIEQLFKENQKISLEKIIINLKGQFSEDEIMNTLYLLQEETTEKDNSLYYSDYSRIYSKFPVKKIIYELEKLFQINFRINLEKIIEHFQENTLFEILTSLQTIINENFVIIDRYGLPTYLRESNDVYFLIRNLSVDSDFYTEYYSRYPCILAGKSFDEITHEINREIVPKIIQNICQNRNSNTWGKLLKSLPKNVQELFIESAILSRSLGITSALQKFILEYYTSYIKNLEEGNYMCTLEKIRCFKKGKWSDCTPADISLLRVLEEEKERKARENNPYGLFGKYNPENNHFCLVDFYQENQDREKKAQNRRSSMTDRRLQYSGKVCTAGGWKIPNLIHIATKRLEIDPPEDFQVKSDMASVLSEYFSEAEIKEATPEMYRRMCYWSLTPNKGGGKSIKNFCTVFREWFEEKGLLEIDNMCGVQGKRKSIVATQEQKSGPSMRVELYTPEKQEEEFKGYLKEIYRIMAEFYPDKDVKKRIEINTDLWVMVFSRKKLVGFISVNSKNNIGYVSVAKNYRRGGIAMLAIKKANETICTRNGSAPLLSVDNSIKMYTKMIRLYEGIGFVVERNDGKTTELRQKC